ncbi:MAG: TolC family protein [Halanaerobium sp.]
MSKYRGLKITVILIFLSIFIACNTAAAEERGFPQALSRALDNNLELKEKKNEVEDLKQDLKIIKAESGWQLDAEADYTEVFNQQQEFNQAVDEESSADNGLAPESNENSSSLMEEGGRSVLSLERNFESGFSITNELSYNDQGEDKYILNLNYPLLPNSPGELEREKFQLEQQLLIAEEEYNSLKNEKLTEWISSYLDSLTLKDNLKSLKKSMEQAENNLNEVEKKAEIKEAGESEILAAEAAFLEAEDSYKNQEANFETQQDNLKVELGLKEKEILKLSLEGEFIELLQKEVKPDIDGDFDQLSEQYLKNNNTLTAQKINLKLEEKQLDWTEADSSISLSLNGSYNSNTEEKTAGISLSYDLYDGGQGELEEEKIADEIALLEQRIGDTKSNLKIELKSQINALEAAERELRKEKVSLKQSELAYQNAENQLDDGTINQSRYLDSEIEYLNALRNFKETENDFTVEKIRLSVMFKENIINSLIREVNND